MRKTRLPLIGLPGASVRPLSRVMSGVKRKATMCEMLPVMLMYAAGDVERDGLNALPSASVDLRVDRVRVSVKRVTPTRIEGVSSGGV